MLAAFAAVSMCAMAQNYGQENSRSSIDATGKSHYDIKQEVLKQDQYLMPGDAYDFEVMLERMPVNAEHALINALFSARRQAVLIHDQTISAMFPVDAMIVSDAPGMDHSAIMAQETETSFRPMRMMMEHSKPRFMDYDTAFSILCTDLNSTERTELGKWWDGYNITLTAWNMDNTNTHAKDIVCQLLKNDAKRADDVIYPSLYMHHVYMVDSK
jgi:hypothetical protein